ncbi:YwqJ-related putative deaminase [Cryptosporangium aurantiacum]|uniref:YwqJ-like deaminase n=1 Tax=Cryptosporangium aurantiacum TaxID=134849 RepID=A0A1M7NH83_9ACTN|nr:YwqJ-related putative deaminase [Cryptosporangium aurantiacum]SHN03169.1 YwqJ-like deaminase [Cryptosporangium aurantiacum]
MTAPGITANEARRIAARWVAESSPDLSPQLYEFDAGFVVWGAGADPQLGAGRGVIDRETGELSVWPALPVEVVAQRYRAARTSLPRPRAAGDQLTQVRRDLDRVGTPATITYLLIDGPPVTARSVKGDSAPQHHPLVEDALQRLPVEFRERGYQRCSEVVALSVALLAEDARRAGAGVAPTTLDEARKRVFRGAELVTYRVREPADPQDAVLGAPCLSCLAMLAYFGFDVAPPEDFWAETDPDA